METNMGFSFRINDIEEEAIRKKAIEINRKLIDAGKAPMKDSELVHEILGKAIKIAKLDENHKITLTKDALAD